MDSYVVLARKWRPAQFSDIVGQGPVVRTLMNAIRAERIHQAYLFTGSRGIGKTTIARVFAKALRCESLKDEGGWLVSCDACSNCREIAAGSSVDVIEIDGASNNGVEAVREIRESAKFMPASGKRKIYLIDEVHMLTTAAFNALLKTLEEPPAHVVFIFATTDPHKIPATILSRCQRFDYRTHSLAQIQGRLDEVLKTEGVPFESGALSLIARAADGSMRDALSLLDQVIAFSGAQITVASTREAVGLIEGQTLLATLRAILERKPLDAIREVDQAYQFGHDLRVLARSLIEFTHAVLLAQVGAERPGALELSEEEWNELRALAGLRPIEEVEMIFQVLHHGLDWIARSPQPKIVLDVLLIKCATAEVLVSAHEPVSATAPVPVVAAKPAPAAVVAPAATPIASPKPTPPPAVVEAPVVASAAPGPKTWEFWIEHVKRSRPLLGSVLEHGVCSSWPQASGQDLVISFPPQEVFFQQQLQSRTSIEQTQLLIKEYLGYPARIVIELREAGESLAAKRERVQGENEQAARDAARKHPVILEAQALFGGELGKIELAKSAAEGGTH